MPFERPTLEELTARILNELALRLNVPVGTLRQTLVEAIGRTNAGTAHGLYGSLNFYARQLFTETAEGDFLDKRLNFRGIFRTQATYARGLVVFTGVNGSIIPENTQIRGPNSITYRTLESGVIGQAPNISGEAIIEVEALTPGVIGNIPTQGQELTLVTTIGGVENTATTDIDGITGGAEQETDESYRQRALDQIITGQLYGKPGDYAIWALSSTSEITKAFEFPNIKRAIDQAGTILRTNPTGVLEIQVLNDNTQVSQGGIQIATDYILPLSPLGIEFIVTTPTLVDNDITLEILPNTGQVQADVNTELAAFYNQVAEPGRTITAVEIYQTVIRVPEITFAIVVIPAVSFTHALTEYPVLGVVAYV